MKRMLFVFLAAMIASVAPVCGQGYVWFDNYQNNGGFGAPVSWTTDATAAPAGQAGLALNVSYNVTFDLFYALGTVTDSTQILSVPAANGTSTIWGGFSGYWIPRVATIADYTGGAVSFLITATGTYNGNAVTGQSLPVNLPSISTGLPDYMDFAPFPVFIVPEPSSIALLSFSAGTLWVFRRRARRGATAIV